MTGCETAGKMAAGARFVKPVITRLVDHKLPANDSQNAALLALLLAFLLALAPVIFGPALPLIRVVILFLLRLASVKKTGLLF